MKRYTGTAALLTVLLSGVVVAAETDREVNPLHDWGEHSKDQLSEGDMVIEADDGTRKVAKVLGAPLGSQTVDGIDVGLFVLQASNPERLKPGAKGPTHIFNVTFKQPDGGSLIKDALGAVIIERPGTESQRITFKLSGAHHRAFARLEEKGEYQIRVDFVTGGHKGLTEARTFDYTGKFMFPGHAQHQH